VHAQLPDGRTQIVAPASVEQFDLQPVGNVMYGYEHGLARRRARPPHRADVALGERCAAVRIWNGGRDVHVRIDAESPLRYFCDRTHNCGARGCLRHKACVASRRFTIEVDVPAALLAQAGGIVTLATDEVFVPAERVRGSTDRRRLGLRVYDVAVTPK